MTEVAKIAAKGPTLFALLLGSGVGFVASAQSWWRASGDGVAVSFRGSDATGGLSQALATVTVVGVLLVLVLRVRGRRLLAVALGATGAGMVLVGALRTAPDADTVRARFRQVSLTDQFALETTGWPWVYAVAGLVVATGAVLLWLGAPRWTDQGSRFERSAIGAGSPAADLSEDPARAWQDLDAGVDPTDSPEQGPKDPDVRTGAEGATMDPTHEHRE